MTTYKEQIKDRKTFVLQKGCVVLATFGNLKKVCEYMAEKKFPSYHTLVRKKDYPLTYNDYTIFKVGHF